MNILQVNSTDFEGQRFNGFDLIEDLRKRGHSCKQCVLHKRSDSPNVVELLPTKRDFEFQSDLQRFELSHSLQNLSFPWARSLIDLPEFQEADVIHYHLVHNNMFSLFELPWLFSLKPSVWTLHDPWMFTGHCIHPMSCIKWKTGCHECPHLDWPMALKCDTTAEHWEIKCKIVSQIENVEIVVASEWMREMFVQSGIFRGRAEPMIVPFGIASTGVNSKSESEFARFSLDGSSAEDSQAEARKQLGITNDSFVMFFRSEPGLIKGTDLIIDALNRNEKLKGATLFTVGKRGLLGKLVVDYQVVEFGWLNDTVKLNQLYAACDVFLMPSRAEAFGLMAIEAMMASRPVICCDGTALPSVIGAPNIGISVPQNDSEALAKALLHQRDNLTESKKRGVAGSNFAEQMYDQEKYLDSLLRIYSNVIS